MAGRVEEKQLSSCRKYHEQRHGDRKLQTVLSTYSVAWVERRSLGLMQ